MIKTMEIDAAKYHNPDLDNVRRLMANTGLLQQELADRLGLTRQAIGKYWSGKTKMPYTVQVCVELLGAAIVAPDDARIDHRRAGILKYADGKRG